MSSEVGILQAVKLALARYRRVRIGVGDGTTIEGFGVMVRTQTELFACTARAGDECDQTWRPIK